MGEAAWKLPGCVAWTGRRYGIGFIHRLALAPRRGLNYNDLGLRGLSSRVPRGSKRRLTPEQEAELAKWVHEGPDLSEHGVVRWRRMDLSRVIEARFGVHLAERGVGEVLRRMGFRRLSARPRHIGHDPQAQDVYKKTLRALSPQ